MSRTPIHSAAGNPFPQGLKPVIVPTAPMPGVAPERMWPRPLPAKLPEPDYSGLITTDEYLYEVFAPDDAWPRLKLRLAPRRADETEAQYEAYRRGIERHTRAHGVYLGLCQQLCTYLGNFATCRERACRRLGECCSRRDEDRTEEWLAAFPPCVPADLDIIESYRTEIREELARALDGQVPPPGLGL